MSVDWGSVPDWANAGASAAALGGAVWAARIAGRALGLERRRQTLAEERDEAAQASAVAVWVTDPSTRTWSAVLRNGSQLPVYDVEVTFQPSVRTDDDLGIATARIHTVGPGDVDIPYPQQFQWPGGNPTTNLVDDLRLSLTFTDAAGVPWSRDENGRLECIRGHDSERVLRGPMP